MLLRLHKNVYKGNVWIINKRIQLLYFQSFRQIYKCSCPIYPRRKHNHCYSWFSNQSNCLPETNSHTLFPTKEDILGRHNTRDYSWFSGQGNGFQNAINNAEKLVGYPTAYNSWKYLFDEEPAAFIGLARKIVGSGHPLLQTARDIFSQDPYSSNHLGGLWVLLISKAAGINTNFDIGDSFVQGIHQKQRILAETTELINTGI